MFYPLQFKPVYKNYLWGGRNLAQFGKTLPAEGVVAESWEVSCHPNGVSIISNGEYAGVPLTRLIRDYAPEIIGTAVFNKTATKFPLLVKLIDAADRLSVQVHPGDDYAFTHEHGESGKNEMWYILAAQSGAELIYDLRPGETRETFTRAIQDGTIANCLKRMKVYPGDVINIPAGLVHAIGAGIVLAEIQQNSDTTYRIHDYGRIDVNGSQRPLHLEKALAVIDFNSYNRQEKIAGLTIRSNADIHRKLLVANLYFAVELYTINGMLEAIADGSKFYIYLIIDGAGEILYDRGTLTARRGDSVLIPAALGTYTFKGNLKALKIYVPDLMKEILTPLKNAGYSADDIYGKIGGLKQWKVNELAEARLKLYNRSKPEG